MLKISEPLVEALTRDSFVSNVMAFLQSKTSDAEILSYLNDKEACETLWEPLLLETGTISEHSLAVRLSYRLACQTKNIKPSLLNRDREEDEIAMMMQLEKWQILDFTDWDK